MKLKTTFIALSLLLCHILAAQEVFKNADLTISKLEQGVWIVETVDMTTMYIVEGEERALLIDTGTQCDSLDRIVRRITSKPLDVVVTHNHIDHAGNIRYFDTVYMHPADSTVRMGMEFHGVYRWLADGDVFDLGNRKIEVVWMPGHTPGSIVLLDKAINACYSGDTFGSGQVWLQLSPHISMQTYFTSCVRMENIMREQQIMKIYCGHYPYLKRALELNYITEMKDLAKRLSEGDTNGSQPYQMPFKTGIVCDKPSMAVNGEAMIVYDSENIN
ncbi:MAG: Hydroxyacylglutathione hydrolase [Candidatus Ordinivivax streblomastigis]|uniref:Hydroxyacylglutathione hydrolase n=1 Tax=Candidatus Ordinivivax streblomastigis TaxID=2540710 RepID=A0A5M8NVB6_9BACT|nr:MAG: Hydroxyacylglutathione hydrolase [Candidatus Ordinivivax streblomastigis]